MKFRKICIFSFVFFLYTNLFAQKQLPFGFRKIQLGLSLNQTKVELLKDPDFGYHGDRDVSLIPGTEQILIETNASRKFDDSYFTQCWFQFYEDKLYTIILNFNKEKIDYYSLFITLKNKYGEPDSLDPQKVTWENDEVTMILEKPLSIKYIDKKIKNELSTYSTITKAAEEISKEMFLDEF